LHLHASVWFGQDEQLSVALHLSLFRWFQIEVPETDMVTGMT